MTRKPSFLERLTGSSHIEDFDDERQPEQQMSDDPNWKAGQEDEQTEGELPVDMYQTEDKIVIRALIAGVNPDNLDIAITRDMVTLKGHREEDREAPEENYFHHELYWGGFSRTILLPEEVVIDESEAKEKHGMLTITLPKLDRKRSARLKVKSQQIKS